MASVVSIWNLGLVPLGADRVMDPLEDSEQARKCNAIYAEIRDDELQSHPWNFAVAYTQCALTTETPTYDYSYAHQLPSDCLRLLTIQDYDYDYKVVGDKIYSNVSTMKIKYIKQITDPNDMSSSFRSVIAARIAYELAYSITNSASATEKFYAIYEQKLKKAKAIDAQEGKPTNLYSDRWVDARNGVVR